MTGDPFHHVRPPLLGHPFPQATLPTLRTSGGSHPTGAALMSTNTVPAEVDGRRNVVLGEDINDAMPVTVHVGIHGAPGNEIAALRFERPWASYSQAMSLPDFMALRDAISRAIEDVTG